MSIPKFKVFIKSTNQIIFEQVGFNPFQVSVLNRMHLRHDEVELMQYIGINDKFESELYRGDLVKSKRANSSLGNMNDIYEIIYDDRYALYCLKCVKSDNIFRVGQIPLTRNDHPYFITSKNTELIGNIYTTDLLTLK